MSHTLTETGTVNVEYSRINIYICAMCGSSMYNNDFFCSGCGCKVGRALNIGYICRTCRGNDKYYCVECSISNRVEKLEKEIGDIRKDINIMHDIMSEMRDIITKQTPGKYIETISQKEISTEKNEIEK